MKRDPKKFTLFLIACAFTLSLKFIFDIPVAYDNNHSNFMATARNSLEKVGYTSLSSTDFRTVAAFKGACFVWIGISRPEGGSEASFVAYYGQLGTLSFWYRNEIFEASPRIRVLVERYIERLMTFTGKRVALHPLYQLISTPQCDINELRQLDLEPTRLS